MAALLIASLIMGAATIGQAAYGGLSAKQKAKKEVEAQRRKAMGEAYGDATGVAGTGVASEQGAMEKILQGSRRAYG